ncbi:hypothetical protein [Pelagicoccus mobilis]|uniref:Uncharacterized protein n=1 Tax=Pelagicoccus mobilis TaxID=415221 RepID=A0A934VMX4_9BACT|nr:hypothetical protein [Pelagicoccus mobilis]MBK1879306.1 hypothetical protein [Pelagicoccus mobilis]
MRPLFTLLFITLHFALHTLHASLVTYPWPETAPKSEYYSAKFLHDGQTTTAFVHGTKPNLNRIPDAVSSEFDDNDGVTGLFEDRSFSFVQFSFTGTIDIEVTKDFGTEASRVEISPKSYGINPYYFDGRTVRFRLTNLDDRIEYLSINYFSDDNRDDGGNGTKHVKHGMVLFADKPESDIPDPDASGTVIYSDEVSNQELAAADIIYFPPGDYDLAKRYPLYDPVEGQKVDLNHNGAQLRYSKNGQAIYAAGGAYIRGGVWAQGKDNLKLYGRGIFTGDDLWWHAIRREGDLRKEAYMNFLGSEDSTFEGIVIVNPTHHTIPSSRRTNIRNLKIIGFASNMDGVRPSEDSFAEELFIRTSDDYDYARGRHTMRNCVFWMPRNGAIGQLGWNNLGTGHTHYDRFYIIHSEAHGDANKRNVGVIGSVLQQGVNLTDNLIENIYGEDGFGVLVHMTIKHEANDEWDRNNPGEIKDFTFRNILLESDFRLNNGERFRNPIKGFEHDGVKAMIRNIRFVNIVAGDTIITQENHAEFFDIDPNTTENITFTTEGTFHTITPSHSSGGSLSPATPTLVTPEGMDRYISVVPDDGYRIKEVSINGIPQGRIQTIHFPKIAADHTVTVEFEPASNDFYEINPDSHPVAETYLWHSSESGRSSQLQLNASPRYEYEVLVSQDLENWSHAKIRANEEALDNPLKPSFSRSLKIDIVETPPFFIKTNRQEK